MEKLLSKQEDTGTPLAGQQTIFKQIQHIISEAKILKKVVVRPMGFFVSQQSWASKTLYNGATKANIPVFEVYNNITAQTAYTRLKQNKEILIIDRYCLEPPPDIRVLDLNIPPLRLAEVRACICFCPKNKEISVQSESPSPQR